MTMYTATHPILEQRKSPDAVLSKCREYFREMDLNGDGKLSKKEFWKMLEYVGMEFNASQLEKVYYSADRNGDGSISLREFIDAYTRKLKTNEGTNCDKNMLPNRLLRRCSSARSPNISQQPQVQSKSPDAVLTKCREYFLNIDVNGDGKLGRSEFLKMIELVGMEMDTTQLEKAYFASNDNGDGHISFNEFVTAYTDIITRNEASASCNGLPHRSVRRCSSNQSPNLSQTTRRQRKMSEATLTIKTPASTIFQRRRSVNSSELGHCLSSNRPLILDAHNSVAHGNGTCAKFCAIFVGNQGLCSPQRNIGSISSNELIACCKYFWSSDKDRDGKLSAYEFSEMLQALGMKLNNHDLHKAFKVADVDADGLISFNEFAIAYLNKNTLQIVSPEQIKNIPASSNGMKTCFISRQECSQAMRMLGNDLKEKDLDRLMRMMDEMDENNNGTLTFANFYAFLGINL